MTIKKYGVSGLIDWSTQIRAGRASFSVYFTGGAITNFGVTPATYTTADPLYQMVIERSDQFKSGRIELIETLDVPDDEPTINPPLTEDGEDGELGQAVGEDAETAAEPIIVADKSEAIEYLKEHFPDREYTATGLRGKAAFDAACKACGVTFVFTA